MVGSSQKDRPTASGREKFGNDCRALRRCLTWSVDGLRQPLAEGSVMIDLRKTQLREGQSPQLPHGVVRRARARSQVVDQLSDCGLVHGYYYPALMAKAEPVAMSTIADALDAANSGEVDAAFVPIENSIEGTVSATLDHLVFDAELFIQLEHVLDIHLDLLAPA